MIVVGGGHNGLVAAAYLAKSGAKTLVLEARSTTGGAATTEAPWPDAPEFRVTRLSYVMSLLPPTIMNDLQLERHGYKVFPMGPYYQAFPEGGSLTLYEEESQRAYDEIAKWSKKDADADSQWNAWLGGLADVLGPLLLTVPPAIGSRKPRDLAATLRLAWRHRGLDVRTIADVTRLMTMSIADLLDDWFESPQIKGALAVNGVIATEARGAGHRLRDGAPLDRRRRRRPAGSWGFPEGGMGAVADAIASALLPATASTIRTGARVARIAVAPGSGRATGVILDSGEELTAKVVVTSSAPQDRLPRPRRPRGTCHRGSRDDIEHWKTRSGVVKINLALAELPDLTANPGAKPALPPHRLGRDGAVDGLHRACLHRRARGPPRPSARSPTASSRPSFDLHPFARGHSHHVAVHPVGPGRLERPSRTREELEKYADRVIDVHNEVAPNFKGAYPAPRRRRPLRHGARLRAHRRQPSTASSPWSSSSTCGRPPASPTTAPRSPASTTPAPPPTPAVASAESPACRRPRPPSPTAARPPAPVAADKIKPNMVNARGFSRRPALIAPTLRTP